MTPPVGGPAPRLATRQRGCRGRGTRRDAVGPRGSVRPRVRSGEWHSESRTAPTCGGAAQDAPTPAFAPTTGADTG